MAETRNSPTILSTEDYLGDLARGDCANGGNNSRRYYWSHGVTPAYFTDVIEGN